MFLRSGYVAFKAKNTDRWLECAQPSVENARNQQLHGLKTSSPRPKPSAERKKVAHGRNAATPFKIGAFFCFGGNGFIIRDDGTQIALVNQMRRKAFFQRANGGNILHAEQISAEGQAGISVRKRVAFVKRKKNGVKKIVKHFFPVRTQ